jgi:hypothetical protein
LFDGRAGAQLAAEFDVPLLATLPFYPAAASLARRAAAGALAEAFLGVIP